MTATTGAGVVRVASFKGCRSFFRSSIAAVTDASAYSEPLVEVAEVVGEQWTESKTLEPILHTGLGVLLDDERPQGRRQATCKAPIFFNAVWVRFLQPGTQGVYHLCVAI